MNKKMILYILGKVLGAEGILMLIPAIVSFAHRERSGISFLIAAIPLLVIYLTLGLRAPQNKTIYGKEGMIIVGAAWILWSFFGAIPYFHSGYIPNFLNAFFESVSGFTTTGSTILLDIQILPTGLMLWRAMTNWIGGMGVLIFVMMLTSLSNDNTMVLLRAELPGPEASKLVPRARSTARILYTIYVFLTVAQTIFLMLGNLDFFDSLLIALSTAGTGGFSNRNTNISYFDSAYIEGVITAFMVMFGINFNLYFLIRLKKWREAAKDEELRAYFAIILATTAIITLNILSLHDSIIQAFRFASFQVASIISTTGFYTANYNAWPELSKNILLILMVIGGCAGSTAGGIKVSRLLILGKGVRQEVKKMLHPKSVTIVTLNGKKVSNETVNKVYIYSTCYVFVLIGSIAIVSLDNYDFATTLGAVFTTLSNVGPGLGAVGPLDSFAVLSPLSRVVLCLNMLIGRLEIFPYLLMLSPALWRRRF